MAVSIVLVRALVDLLARRGVDTGVFLGRAGLDAAGLDDLERRIELPVFVGAIEEAMALAREPALGLRWAERFDDRMMAPLAPLVAHAPTLGDGLERLLRYGRLLIDDLPVEILEGDTTTAIRVLPLPGASPAARRLMAEVSVGGLYGLVRGGPLVTTPITLAFAHAAPAYAAEYRAIFGDRVRFGQPFPELRLDRAHLGAASPFRDDEVSEVLATVAEQRLVRLGFADGNAARVRALLEASPQPHRRPMTEVARELGMSVRSLRRRLTDEGVAFDALVSEAFASVAMRRLRDRSESIASVAEALGFADVSAFHRAFKRSTGKTPGAVRSSD